MRRWNHTSLSSTEFKLLFVQRLCNTPQQKIQTRFFLFYIYAYFSAYILVCIHLRMIRFSCTHFKTQTISYLDSASCAGNVTEPATLFSDHNQSGLSRVVCIERVIVVYPYMHVCALLLSTRLSRLKPQCFLN